MFYRPGGLKLSRLLRLNSGAGEPELGGSASICRLWAGLNLYASSGLVFAVSGLPAGGRIKARKRRQFRFCCFRRCLCFFAILSGQEAFGRPPYRAGKFRNIDKSRL
ncbi:hypothetical protein DPQ22_02385 [Candidatus Tokpelaia sp.]|nr:hypothetical protein DPQ22_02385 [Candidatus Tokpelaia sp.]